MEMDMEEEGRDAETRVHIIPHPGSIYQEQSNIGICVGSSHGLSDISFRHLSDLANAATMDNTLMANSVVHSCRKVSSSDTGRYGALTSEKRSYDLNLLPEEMNNVVADSLEAEFVPITPQKSPEPVTDSLLHNDSVEAKENRKKTKRDKQDSCLNKTDELLQIKTPLQKPKRKKHRPKVVTQGKANRSSKSEILKTAESKQKKSKNKGLESLQSDNMSECKSYSRPKRATRRALHFDYELLREDESFEFMSASDTGHQLQQNLCSNAGKDLCILSVNQSKKDDDSSGRREAPSTPLQMFSNIPKRRRGCSPLDGYIAHDLSPSGHENTVLMETRVAEKSDMAANNLHMFETMFQVQFPNIRRKRRTDERNLAMSVSITARKDTSRWLEELKSPKKLRRKRSRTVTRARNFRSLKRILKCILPAKSDRQEHVASIIPQRLEDIVSDMQSTMSRKKRTKRNSLISRIHARNLQMQWGLSLSANSIGISVDVLSEWFEQLNINRQNAMILHQTRYREQNSLVKYKRDGSIVPFGRFPYASRRKLPRPVVKLDDETARVWKLLMVDINSEGTDGTDEEKEKWWKEERTVFHGRADSFIARMRLVQGDRRFSPWKGSVVDSVIGVFLTQNVSDHLSSSAFMAMAAEFPLKLNSDKRSCNDESGNSLTHEPFMCLEDSGDVGLSPIQELIHEEDNNAASKISGSFISSSEGILPGQDYFLSQDSKNAEKMDSTKDGFRLNSSTAPLPDLLETSEDINASLLNSSLVNKDLNLEMIEGEHQIPYKDRGISIISSNPSSFQSVLNQDMLDTSELFRNKPHEDSGSSNLYPQDDDMVLQAQNKGEQKRIEQHINTKNLKRESPSAILIEDHLNTQNKTSESVMKEQTSPSSGNNKRKASTSKIERGIAKNQNKIHDWDSLRKNAEKGDRKKKRSARTMDSVDWEAVRCADVDQIAKTIRARGMNNMLSERIKGFLNRLVEEHGGIDLEWLRDIPPDKAKEYLLSIKGLGLKSVECVRLLTLHHLAFPVDTNVGRIAVRLGWVPLQPLPESLQLHLLELYPILESIQKYLWPRLCKLDQGTLYELHYHMITFGKVFCTKSKPNCNACPLRGECRHFASAFASARLALPGPEEKRITRADEREADLEPVVVNFRQSLLLPQGIDQQQTLQTIDITKLKARSEPENCEPIIEEPTTPEPESIQVPENDIEDVFDDNSDDIPTIRLNIDTFNKNLQNYMQKHLNCQQGNVSQALVALTTEAASIPMPKLKNMSRLRTEHQVYELPDSHPLLEGLDKREDDDPCSYLLALWTPGETADSIQPPEKICVSQENNTLCPKKTCFSCNTIREERSQIVRGTLLIPCRTAMRGSFPLNGTYFQVNEVFADHDSSLNPVEVPRDWIWNLPRRTVYFGTSIPAIFRGLTTEAIQRCFWRGYVCVRGIDQKTRAPRPLMARLHFPASKQRKRNLRTNEEET